MNSRSIGKICKNALGAVFLLAGAFFVCSTLLSMRAVLADPIAPTMVNEAPIVQSGRTSGRASPRNNAATARPTSNAVQANSSSRGVAKRNIASRTNANAASAQSNSSRGVVARSAKAVPATRNVVSRGKSTRNVRSRAATSSARVGVTGEVIRGSKSSNSTYYTYLSSKLYTGNYSNIIDSTTGLISADAYSTCLESYYTCMDEICTARSEAQRRCACAGRVKAFAEAESALESANEELIKISGELALLIANKGKDVSAAFTLTDAEKVMNCASWREASKNKTATADEFGTWCEDHGLYTTSECSRTQAPEYCTNESVYGFDVANLDGAGSDILASLASWADEVKSNTDTILKTDDDSLFGSITTMANAISGITGSAISLSADEVQDTLAETWGYDLFRYAHNNVCARVLDSCFNGIYEGCGTPPSGGRCANGASSACPFNYNSKVEISSSGDVTLNERSTTTSNASATCFGYSSSSGDPYSALRGPVADARRSVMQKYLLDANADCDLYGDQLKATAQKIAYQKVAAQQALQQKRLEFHNEEQEQILADAIAASTNFNECISELWECYQTQESANPSWTTARIKTYCAQIANVPHCYQEMICSPSEAQFKAVIDVADKTNCTWDASDYTKNDCRNVVTLFEILNGTGAETDSTNNPSNSSIASTSSRDSKQIRGDCLRENLGCPYDSSLGESETDCIRTWKHIIPTAND